MSNFATITLAAGALNTICIKIHNAQRSLRVLCLKYPEFFDFPNDQGNVDSKHSRRNRNVVTALFLI